MTIREFSSIRHIPTRIRRLLEYATETMARLPEDAQHASEEALRLSEQQRNRALRSNSHRTLGLSLFYLRSYAAAIGHFQQALGLYEKLRDINAQARTLQNIGVSHVRLGQLETAMQNYQRSAELFKRSHDLPNRALVLINMAVVYTQQLNQLKAFEMYSDALQILEANNNEAGIATVSGNLGLMFVEMGENDKGLQWMERSLDMHRRTHSVRGEAFALREIGTVHRRISKLREARQYYAAALAMVEQSNDRASQAEIRIQIAELYLDEKRYAKAQEHCERARALFLEVQHTRNVAFSYNVSAKIKQAQHKTDEARQAWEQALHFIEKTDNYAERAEYELHLAEMLLEQKQERSAKKHLATVEQLCIDHHLLATQIQVYRLYSELEESHKNASKALRYARLSQKAQQEYEQQLNSRKVQDLKYRVDIARVERDREQIRLQSEQYRSQLESKSKELNASALVLAQKNEVISALKQRIQGLARVGAPTSSNDLRQLLSLIDEHVRGDKQMEGVTKQLSDFHQDFLSKLSAEFKTLTPTEIKICSLLKLNLNTKEIADFLCVSFKSVEVYRARIRKKLGLKEGDNLSAFIVGYESQHPHTAA